MLEANPERRLARRDLWLRALVLAGAIALGLALQQVLARRLEELDALAKTDLLRARAELATLLKGIAVALFGLTGAVGAGVIASSRRALALGQFPAPGRWSWGARRVVSGVAAQRFARVGIGLGVLLIAASAAGGGLLWYMASVVAACRAGVR